MKARTVGLALAFGSLFFASRADAQGGCQVTPHYSNYATQSFDDSNFTLTQTVTTDGYGTMNLEFCLEAENARHTPHGVNKITANGTVHGGAFSGSPVCAVNCYVFAQNTISFQGNPGDVDTDEVDGSVSCSVAGTFWSVTNSGILRFIQAYYKCTNWTGGQCAVNNQIAQRPYARCNPQGDACDEVEMGKSPLSDGSWPQFVLMNGVFFTIPGEADFCLVGHNGTRADKCISPDPKP